MTAASVLRRERHHAVEPRAGTVAVLEVGRVEHRTPADVAKARLHHGGLGRVEHQRHARLRREASGELIHVGDTVASDIVDAEIEHVGAFTDLIGGHADARVPVGRQHRVAERLRAVRVRALADDEERRVLRDRLGAVEGGERRLVERIATRRCQITAALDHGAQVLGRRAAAAADDPHAEVADEPRQMVGQVFGRQVVVRASVDDAREASVGEHRDRHAGVLRQVSQVLGHLAGACRAVEPEDVGLQRSERDERGADLAADEHAARRLHRHLQLHRDAPALRRHRSASADHGCLRLQEVVTGLDEQEIHAALEQPARHHLIRVAQRDERDVAERRELRPRPHRAGDPSPSPVGGEVVADRRREPCRGDADLVRAILQAVLREDGRERAEGVRLHDVDADVEERGVQVADHVRSGHGEGIDAALDVGTAVVVDGWLAQMEVRADGAVVDDDALVHRLQERHSRQATGALSSSSGR